MGASSFSPSPITTTPCISTPSRAWRMASTAAWSTFSLSPLPIQRPALSAAASVTRTSSIPRLRSLVPDCSKRSSDISKPPALMTLNYEFARVNTTVLGHHDSAQVIHGFLKVTLLVVDHVVVPVLLG